MPALKRYTDKEVIRIRALRKREHYSFAELQRMTGIPASTIRNWCVGDFVITRSDALLLSNERKRQAFRQSEQASLDVVRELDAVNAMVYVSLLYGCEGSKYPAHCGVAFVNSDPALIKLFVNLLKKSFSLDELKWRVHLQIHDIHNLDEVREYWSRLLLIPETQFIKPTVTHARGGKHRRLYWGTCTVRYADYRIQLKLLGLYEEFIKKFS